MQLLLGFEHFEIVSLVQFGRWNIFGQRPKEGCSGGGGRGGTAENKCVAGVAALGAGVLGRMCVCVSFVLSHLSASMSPIFLFVISYAPKKTPPPRLIHSTLGASPENSRGMPPSLYTDRKVATTPGCAPLPTER